MKRINLVFLFLIALISCRKESPQAAVQRSTPPLQSVTPQPITQTVYAKLSVKLLLNLSAGSSNTADGCLFVFWPDFTATVASEDSWKISNGGENLGIQNGTTLLAIEGRPLPYTTLTDTLQLATFGYRQGSYFVRVTGSAFPAGVSATLKDTFTGISYTIDLAGTADVPITVTSPGSNIRSRFQVHIHGY